MTIRAWMCGLSVVALAACGDDALGFDALVGTWSLASYDDHGTIGVTTGTWVFMSDSTFVVQGTVTYPGEPTDSLLVDGSYAVRPDTVDLTIEGETTAWGLSLPAADTAVLSHRDAEGMARITLAK